MTRYTRHDEIVPCRTWYYLGEVYYLRFYIRNVKKTRILMFGWEFPPFNSGGLGVACLGLTRALSERDTEVIFVMPRELDLSIPWAKTVFAMGEGKIRGHYINSILMPYSTSVSYGQEWERRITAGDSTGIYAGDLMGEVLRYASLGGDIAKQEDFDVIYAHDWLAFGAGMEAKRTTGKPLIVHVHATEFDRCGGSNVNQAVYDIERAGMETADIVIAVSEFTKSIIVREYGIPAEKVRVVYNGIDEVTSPHGDGTLPRLHALKRAGYKIVLFLGRLTLQKGPDYFIRAAKKVLEHNRCIVFVMAGSGDMERSMIQFASELGIAQHMLFAGFLGGNDRYEMYAAADLFIMPSVSEPFGITPLEAMKLGTPVIISKQSGVSEVVQHALKVDFWDVDEMANQILAVTGYPGLCESLAENASREVNGLTWDAAAEKVEGIVREVV